MMVILPNTAVAETNSRCSFYLVLQNLDDLSKGCWCARKPSLRTSFPCVVTLAPTLYPKTIIFLKTSYTSTLCAPGHWFFPRFFSDVCMFFASPVSLGRSYVARDTSRCCQVELQPPLMSITSSYFFEALGRHMNAANKYTLF